MAHKEQWVFCGQVKGLHPEYFENKKVLDIGSFDVNGNEEFLFKNCDFTGLDIGEGDGVDVVCPAQDYDEPDETFDTIISCECWEHNPFYKESIQNAVRMLKSGGLFFFTCATIGRPVHGVSYLEKDCSEQHKNWKTMFFPRIIYEYILNPYSNKVFFGAFKNFFHVGGNGSITIVFIYSETSAVDTHHFFKHF